MRASTASIIALATLWAATEIGIAQNVLTTRDGGKPMTRAKINGVELEYDVRGSGAPVVLVHAGIFADWFKPLVDEPALATRYRVVSYHRVGYAGSSRVAGSVSIAASPRITRRTPSWLDRARLWNQRHASQRPP